MKLTNEQLQDWDDDYGEDDCHTECPKCGRDYDDIDYEYQICSKCGWNANKVREPSEQDYLNGDADILTGRWI